VTQLVRMGLRKLGRIGLLFILTILSTTLAIILNFLIVEWLDYTYVPEQDIVIISIITVSVTPLLSWYLIGLFFKIDQMEMQMMELATIDSMTNTYNRGYFYKNSEQYLSKLSEQKQPNQSSLLVLDLDDLKRINDQFGHSGGDKVLIAFSKILLREVKPPNFVGRLGGDEFVVFLKQSSLNDAQTLATKLLDIIRSAKVECDDHSISFSVSVGLSSFTGYDMQALDRAIKSADSALYDVKCSGRNSYAVYYSNQE